MPSEVLKIAIDAAVDAGVVVVASAGDLGADACSYSPGNVDKAITVGAATIGDASTVMNDQSNFGECVDIFAPGMIAERMGLQTTDTKHTSDPPWVSGNTNTIEKERHALSSSTRCRRRCTHSGSRSHS